MVFFGCASSQNVTTASLTHAASGSTLSVTTSVTTGNGTGGRGGGADAVSMSYFVFALTLLCAYFMQFMEH